MSSRFELEPRAGEGGLATYQDYLQALEPFAEWSRDALRCTNGEPLHYLQKTENVAHALADLDPCAIQYPPADIDSVTQFGNATDILTTRARILASRGDKGSAIRELCNALRLARKLRESQGPMLIWLCGVGCEHRTLRALSYVLPGISGRRLKEPIWREFPTADHQRSELADTWRAEYIYIKNKAMEMPLQEIVRDYVKIGWIPRLLDETKESAWPLEDWIFDAESTMRMVEDIIGKEIGWWESGVGAPPQYKHYWAGVPEPPDPGRDPRRFRKLIADIENPLGKHVARRIGKVCWMGRTAASIRRRRLAVKRFSYALRSFTFSELLHVENN